MLSCDLLLRSVFTGTKLTSREGCSEMKPNARVNMYFLHCKTCLHQASFCNSISTGSQLKSNLYEMYTSQRLTLPASKHFLKVVRVGGEVGRVGRVGLIYGGDGRLTVGNL